MRYYANVSGSEDGPTCNELCIVVNDPFILVESSVNIDNGTLALVEDTVDSVEDTVIPVEASAIPLMLLILYQFLKH